MILRIPGVLSASEVGHCRSVLERARWIDGRETAGEQAREAKHNLQLPEDSAEAAALGQIVLAALARAPLFMSAALPSKVFPPLFNLYRRGMGFAPHVDNAVRTSVVAGARMRTDLSATLFLAEPAEYEGGELVIEDALEPRRVKLPAGDLALYPASAVHRVDPVRSGARWASFFWVQSMVAGAERRDLLFDLDRAIAAARADLGDTHAAAVALTGAYHNLVRLWAAP